MVVVVAAAMWLGMLYWCLVMSNAYGDVGINCGTVLILLLCEGKLILVVCGRLKWGVGVLLG